MVIEDFNGDGLTDMAIAGIIRGSGSSTPGVILQTAPREFGEVISLPGFGSSSVAVSDLNMDGASDLLSVSGSDRKLRSYFGAPRLCPADLNGDSVLNYFDVSVLIQTQPDYNNDGSFNFYDVSAFIADYLAGCP